MQTPRKRPTVDELAYQLTLAVTNELGKTRIKPVTPSPTFTVSEDISRNTLKINIEILIYPSEFVVH